MPLEMRLIIWNLRNCAPKDGYTSDVKVFAELLGWGRMKETDCDMGVKVSRSVAALRVGDAQGRMRPWEDM
eukprot:1136204-Rhodomonas_salina.2